MMTSSNFGELPVYTTQLESYTRDINDIIASPSSENTQKVQRATKKIGYTLHELELRIAESRLQSTTNKLEGRAEDWSKFLQEISNLEDAVNRLKQSTTETRDFGKIKKVFKKIKQTAKELEISSTSVKAIERVPKQVQVFQEKQEKVLKLLHSEFPYRSYGACNLAIVENGEVQFAFTTGMADWEKNTLMTPDLPQHYGSVSKHVTSICIARLMEEGRLKLTDPIHKYLPDLPQFKFQGQEVVITIDDMLQMRSGLFDIVNVARVLGEDQELSMSEKLKWIAEVPDLLFKPNEKGRMYCDANHYLLSQVVEKITGKSFTEYAQEMFASLMMKNTTFSDPTKNFEEQPYSSKMVKGYRADEETSQLQIDTISKKPAECTTHNLTVGPCGAVGSLNDFVKGWIPYLIQYQNRSDFFSTPDVGDHYRYARGLWTNNCSGYRVLRHSGGIEGYRTEFLWLHKPKKGESPEKEISIVWFSNTGKKEFEDQIDEIARIWTGDKIAFPRPSPQIEKETEVLALTRKDADLLQREYACEQSRINSTYRIEQGLNKDGVQGFYLKRVGGLFPSDPIFLVPTAQDSDTITLELRGSYLGQVKFDKKTHEFSLSIPDRIVQNLKFKPK
jgi:CubicO group peptidase (beta-lactamase class C family)